MEKFSPVSRDVIIIIEINISKKWRQQNYELSFLKTLYFWNLPLNAFLTMTQPFW